MSERGGGRRRRRGGSTPSLAWLAAAPAAAIALLADPRSSGRRWVACSSRSRRATSGPRRWPSSSPSRPRRLATCWPCWERSWFPSYVLWADERGFRPVIPRALVIVLQLVFVAVLTFAVFCRRGSVHLDISYFDLPTVAVALGDLRRLRRRAPRSRPCSRGCVRCSARRGLVLRWGAVAIAALFTAIWLLPAIQRDATVAHASPRPLRPHLHLRRGLSVFNGHSPLVNYVAQYGSLWPYVIAIPMHLGNGSLGAYTTSMASITLVAMLAVYGVIRRVAESPVAALALFLALHGDELLHPARDPDPPLQLRRLLRRLSAALRGPVLRPLLPRPPPRGRAAAPGRSGSSWSPASRSSTTAISASPRWARRRSPWSPRPTCRGPGVGWLGAGRRSAPAGCSAPSSWSRSSPSPGPASCPTSRSSSATPTSSPWPATTCCRCPGSASGWRSTSPSAPRWSSPRCCCCVREHDG